MSEPIQYAGPAVHRKLPAGWRRYTVTEYARVTAKPTNSPGARAGLLSSATEADECYVLYEVRTDRRPAFKLCVTGTKRSLSDTWALRREIARHAGVDPDMVHPQWQRDATRLLLGRYSPTAWLVAPASEEEEEKPCE